MRFDFGETQIKLSFSFVAIVTLMMLLCEEKIVIISLFSSLFHEGGHLLMMLIFYNVPRRICFGAFGVCIERATDGNINYKKEAFIALGGITVNLILAFLSLLFYYFSRSQFCFEFFSVNVFVALFNLMPVRQLDAGRFLECVFKSLTDITTSEKLIGIFSLITVFCLLAGCVLYNIFIGVNVSLIAVTFYLISISIFKEFSNDK